jgi:hypothetical protein
MADFLREKYVTASVSCTVSPFLQLFLWHLVERRSEIGKLDYLQVFDLKPGRNNYEIIIRHRQEVPPFSYECRLRGIEPMTAKIYIIDNGDGTATMLLAEEY